MHNDIQRGQDSLYECARCAQVFVIQAVQRPIPVESEAPPADAAVPPEVDISSKLRPYFEGRPRELPIGARKRRPKSR